MPNRFVGIAHRTCLRRWTGDRAGSFSLVLPPRAGIPRLWPACLISVLSSSRVPLSRSSLVPPVFLQLTFPLPLAGLRLFWCGSHSLRLWLEGALSLRWVFAPAPTWSVLMGTSTTCWAQPVEENDKLNMALLDTRRPSSGSFPSRVWS